MLLPTVAPETLISGSGIFSAKWEYQTINVELTHRILINSLSGKKSPAAMLAYLSGLSATKYVVGGSIVDLTKIEVTDCIPEITYVLLLMSNNNNIIKWQSMLYLNNNNFGDAKFNVYEFLFTKCLKMWQSLDNDSYEFVNSNLKSSS